MPARTAFFGTPATAVPALAALCASTRVELVVTQPDRARGRSGTPQPPAVKEAAAAWGLPIAQPSRAADVAAQLDGLDLCVVVAYGQILPAPMLQKPRLGFINLHFSLLPRWRGAAPVARAILAGDDATGVDIMALDPGMDSGDLIARREVAIEADDTTGTLTGRLAGLGAGLLLETLPAILDGTAARTPQPATGITHAAKLDSAGGRLDPATMPAEDCDRVVRAFNPNPGAWGIVDGERLKVWRSRVAEPAKLDPAHTQQEDDRVLVGTPDGVWELIEVQAAGKGRMAAATWARGHRGEFRWE